MYWSRNATANDCPLWRCRTMMNRLSRIALIAAALAACSPAEPPRRSDEVVAVPAEIARLATDSLEAASEIKVSGDRDAVLRERPLSPRYAPAMRKHFELKGELHRVGLRAKIRYPRYELAVRHDQFCEAGGVAHLVVTAYVRYHMEAIPPNDASPPYTASERKNTSSASSATRQVPGASRSIMRSASVRCINPPW
jgi:hypothetical protein